MFHTPMPKRIERADPKVHPAGWRIAPEPDLPDPLFYCDGEGRRDLDLLCRSLAETASEHERMYTSWDFVRVMEHFAYQRADALIERQAANWEAKRQA